MEIHALASSLPFDSQEPRLPLQLRADRGRAERRWCFVHRAPEDRFFPITLAERLARAFSQRAAQAIDDAFVFAQEDQPRAVANAIGAFV